MGHSLLTASRNTHLKIVVVALLGAILVVTVGISAHIGAAASVALGPVVKADDPVSFTRQGGDAVVR
jgi:hypothetical protein